jgi:hypothetical protein
VAPYAWPPRPLAYAELSDLLSELTPPPPPIRLIAHPSVVTFLRDQYPDDQAPAGAQAAAAFLGSIPVVEDPAMPPGAWEIRAGDEVVESGNIRAEYL